MALQTVFDKLDNEYQELLKEIIGKKDERSLMLAMSKWSGVKPKMVQAITAALVDIHENSGLSYTQLACLAILTSVSMEGKENV